jgi:hypothetical protein
MSHDALLQLPSAKGGRHFLQLIVSFEPGSSILNALNRLV